MPQINFVWNDSEGRIQAYQLFLSEADLGKTINIGRDQQKCELWLAHNTVSRVHAEVSFKPEWQRFYLRNLAAKNPVRVDGGLLEKGETALYEGSMVQFGQLLLQVSDVAVNPVVHHHHHQSSPVTSPIGQPAPGSQSAPEAPAQYVQAPAAHAQAATPQGQPVPSSPTPNAPIPSSQTPSVAPKLVCPKCGTLQVLSLRNSNCPVCGHFLADASSRYFF